MPVNPQTSQANDASQADQDSPFALLMAASAPKDDEPVRAQDAEEKRPANDQASAAQPAPVKPQSRPESKTEAKPKAKTDEKTKTDENKTAEDDGQEKPEDVAVANDNTAAPAPESKPGSTNPVPPPQLVVPLIVIADTVEKPVTAETSVPQDVAPATPAAAPTQDIAALTAAQAAARSTANDAAPQTGSAAATPVAAETQAAPQSQQQQTAAPQEPGSQTPAQQTPTQQTQGQQASGPQPPVSETPQEALDPATPQPVVQPVAAQQTDATQSPAPTKEALVQIATLQNPTSAKPAETGEQTETTAPASTTDAAKAVTHELPAQHADNKEAKADTPRPEIAKPDAVKPDASQPAPVETAASKPAPQTQVSPSTNIASVQTGPVPQPGVTPTALPGIPQHVQVSAQAPTPNMPALAVEIAAKSQSGAKQFDIRLDPPELGRVEVRLSIDAAGKASAHLSADQPQTLDLLQKDASSLTRALREAGLNVSQDGLNFSLRQQNHDGNSAQQGQGQGRNASRGMNLIATNSIEATQNSASWRGDGRLDIRV